jgi:serine/threonine protein phosphatase PrpC
MVKKANIIDFSFTGYKHAKANIPNQDYSASIHGKDFFMIGVADGHSSDLYFRSERGSRYAVLAAFDQLEKFHAEGVYTNDAINQLKIKILSHWNKLIDDDINRDMFKNEETSKLTPKDFSKLKENLSYAYGTTLTCALINNSNVVVLSIGDSNAMYYDLDLKPYQLFATDDENESNTQITNSMCEEDAFKHLNHAILESSDISAIALSTDGALNPYQSFMNYQYYIPLMFLKERFARNAEIGDKLLENFISELAKSKGNGDDVSFAMYYREDISTEKLEMFNHLQITEYIKSLDYLPERFDWLISNYMSLPTLSKQKLFRYIKLNKLEWEDTKKETAFVKMINSKIDPLEAMILIETKES